MLKQISRPRSALALIFGMSLLCLGTLARADNDRGDNQGNRYHYRDGQWYGQGDVVVPDIAIGAVVDSLPPQNKIVVFGNVHYIYDNTRYYIQSPDGSYVVVAAPENR
jgi:hypothetical protein